jgi:hypothetical protein
MAKKKTVTKKPATQSRSLAETLNACFADSRRASIANHNATNEIQHRHTDKLDAIFEMLAAHVKYQTHLVSILLNRCDAQDKQLAGISDTLATLTARATKQDQQLDRMISLHWLMLKRFQETADPALQESIRRDLRAPTLTPHEHVNESDGNTWTAR